MKPPRRLVKLVLSGICHVLRDRRGATAIEYGLILALVFLAMVASVSSLGSVTVNMWGNVNAQVAAAH